MTLTLTDSLESLSAQLSDRTNLVWDTTLLEEALRTSLNELSVVCGTVQTLNGLDGALVTTMDEVDRPVLMLGAAAYALTFRAVGRFEAVTPAPDLAIELGDLAQKTMKRFQSLLVRTQLRKFQESTSHPYGQWAWDEGDTFS